MYVLYNTHFVGFSMCSNNAYICDYVSPFSNTRAEDNKTLFCLIAVFPSLPQDSLVSDNPMTLALT